MKDAADEGPTNKELDEWFGPAHEETENGAEPDNAINPHADREQIEPPEWEDELDIGPGVAEARHAVAQALQHRDAERELEAGG